MCDGGSSSVDIATLVFVVLTLFVLLVWAALEAKQLYVFKEIAEFLSKPENMGKIRTA